VREEVAHRGIVALAFHKGDAAVAKVLEVTKSHASSGIVIEHDVPDTRLKGRTGRDG